MVAKATAVNWHHIQMHISVFTIKFHKTSPKSGVIIFIYSREKLYKNEGGGVGRLI